MSSRRERAILALARWRAFQEKLAQRSYLNCAAVVINAAGRVLETEAREASTQAYCSAALSRKPIDVEKWRFANGLAHAAQEDAEQSRDALAVARFKQDEALKAYGQARACNGVVSRRNDKVRRDSADGREKRSFDRMAEVRAGRINGGRHD
ncbi:hypothetical protein [Arenimonas terrae]|uniref:Uncharacterized protein n=1 Tax=Arenimonas terrae TaxID=2546226 RepID=A0A5C4RQ02_9GAMM|nr:hypothetical protein [Arenimonas terrae]TNJ33232.1 hypothetical protein E1B00_13110 [Arenimonas terrae]